MIITSINNPQEKRVMITPSTVEKYIQMGLTVSLPKGYGNDFSDHEYIAAGANICEQPVGDIYLCINPDLKDIKFKQGDLLITSIAANRYNELNNVSSHGVKCFVLEKIPRITRAQSMDILSSQANIAGYRAVIEAMNIYTRVIPMMMTAAGTVRPAKVLVIGAGVAGLQAIATAKRLGAVVSAFDVRSAAKEQVKSLGANFVDVDKIEDGEDSSGYAKEMDEDYKKRQSEKLKEVIAKSDIVITTAQIPGKPAPLLITKEMIKSMQYGSVIVDMAVATGGNCELSQFNKIVHLENVTIIGYSDLAARISFDASNLLSNNVLQFIKLIIKDNTV